MVYLIDSLVDFVKAQREFDHFNVMGVSLCGHSQYNSGFKRLQVRNRRYFGEKVEYSMVSPKDKFKEELFLVIIDHLIRDLKYRLEAYQEINLKIGFLSELPFLSSKDQGSSIKTCVYVCQ